MFTDRIICIRTLTLLYKFYTLVFPSARQDGIKNSFGDVIFSSGFFHFLRTRGQVQEDTRVKVGTERAVVVSKMRQFLGTELKRMWENEDIV